MERHFEDHHYRPHWQPPAAPYPPYPPPPPNFFHPPPPPQHHLQHQHLQQHQRPYFNRPPDHYGDHNNAHPFHHPNPIPVPNPIPIPNPDPYPNYNNNHMTSNEPVDSFGGFCSNGRKRGRHFPDPKGDAFHAKLYVSPVPSTTTEENVRPLFEEHGHIVEIVFPRDKRTGQRCGYIFIKYATMEEADRAIRALNEQYTFPGEKETMKVRYADKERERPAILERERYGKGEREQAGGDEVVSKIYVGAVNKQASNEEVLEIFSPYGVVEDVYIARDSQKQSRGYAFVRYLQRDMAVAAIKALNGTFTMRGCNEPLIVRFADPKKRKSGGELRGNHAISGQNFGSCSQEHMIRPASSFGNGMGGCMLLNPPYPMQQSSLYSQPQAASNTVNLALGEPPTMEQALPIAKQPTAQLCHMPPEEVQAPNNFLQLSQQAMPETTKHAQNLDQQQSAQVSLESSLNGNNPPVVDVTSAAPPASLSPQTADPQECDWSEHACPDGYKYYYNCITYESRWEKPDELTSFQQQLLKQQIQSPSQQPDPPSRGFCGEEVKQIQKDLDPVKIQSHSRPFVDPACV